MSATACPHGLPPKTCEICRIVAPTPVRPAPARRPARPGTFTGGLATVAVVAIVGFVVLGWVAAAFFAVLRILELVVVAGAAGWVGWQLGVRRGRRQR